MRYVFLGIITVAIDNILAAYVVTQLPALTTATFWAIAGALASLISLIIHPIKLREAASFFRHPIQLLLFFALSVAAAFCWYHSLKTVGAGVSSVVGQTRLLFLLLIGVVFFKERLGLRDLLATTLIVFGIFLFSYRADLVYKIGLLYALGAMLCYSGQKILNKTLAEQIPYRLVVFVRAAVLIFALGTLAHLNGESLAIPNSPFLICCILVGGTCGSFLSKYFDFKALEQIDLSLYSLWQPGKPVLVLTLSIIILGESAAWNKITGAMIILGGLLMLLTRGSQLKSDY